MSLADDVERLTGIVVRDFQGGRAERLRLGSFPARGDWGLGQVAKACGTTPEVVRGWEDGTLQPSTQQALTWLSFLQANRQPTLREQLRRRAEREAAARDSAGDVA